MFLHIFLLVSALCLDTFVASAAYGTNQVRLSWKQILAVNGICSLCLGISLLFGNLLDRIIPETFTREICFFQPPLPWVPETDGLQHPAVSQAP